MAITPRDLRLLYQQSGNRCAFPGCTRLLTQPATLSDAPVPLSEVAHIVAQSSDGPRGDHPLPLEERDRYGNLILLCEEHHHIVDQQPATYPVERLRQMKIDHEAMVAEAMRRAVEARAGSSAQTGYTQENLFSSLLPVTRLPKYIYSCECDYSDDQEKEVAKLVVPANDGQVWPFLIRSGNLICFQNLQNPRGPFRDLADGREVTRDECVDWWEDDGRLDWFISLLNRTLNKVTGRKGLNLDKRHRRYYFEPTEPGKPLEVEYRPMNQSISSLQVVWQPITKKTQQPKKFWYHRAAALRFHRVSPRGWCLSIRPEMRVTRDGVHPIDSDKVGSRVTRKKARAFNFDVLRELQFWRDFLFDGEPRLIVSYGSPQALVISSTFLQTTIKWPGVPPERAKTFQNAQYEEDLFTLAALDKLDEGNEDDDQDVEELDDDAE